VCGTGTLRGTDSLDGTRSLDDTGCLDRTGRLDRASFLDRTGRSEQRAFSLARHAAGRCMSRHEALRRYRGCSMVDKLADRGILVRSPSIEISGRVD